MNKLSPLVTIALGVLLIAIIVPLTQFLTVGALTADIEVMTPVPWAVGLIFSIVVVMAVLRLFVKRELLSKRNTVLLYAMLTIAVPLMNLGLVRQFYLTVNAALREYLVFFGTNTYRTVYDSQKDEWFPIVPDRYGLAWNKTDRLLEMLDDASVRRARGEAKTELIDEVVKVSEMLEERAESGETGAWHPPPGERETWLELVGKLHVTEINSLQAWVRKFEKTEALEAMGLVQPLEEALAEANEASDDAVAALERKLDGVDEFTVQQLPSFMDRWALSTQEKILEERRRLTDEEKKANQRRIEGLQPRLDELRELATELSATDRIRLTNMQAEDVMAEYRQLSDKQIDEIRSSFVFRLTQDQRKTLARQDGDKGRPNLNLAGFQETIWLTDQEKNVKARREGVAGFMANLRDVWTGLPWHIWLTPLLLWGLMFVALFLLVMCLAEWLRRKWVDRENLAFPLVEVADGLIRHEYDLEEAEDVYHPPKRKKMFNGLFWIGVVIGFAWLSAEAVGHYGMVAEDYTTSFNVSSELFTTGALKDMDKVFFVLSPVVLGIAFLVSLEISFSVWALFILYSLAVLVGEISNPNIKDGLYTGWGGGRQYPFQMAQMLGASICFSLILMYKSFRSRRQKSAADESDAFIPPRLNKAGLIVLPALLIVLLWHYGVLSSFGGWVLMLLVAFLILMQTVAAARLRAETGLPTHHSSYEFTKVPLVFGMTGLTGARVYTLYISLAFLPMSLLFRTLPQHLENMELARRAKLRLRTLAGASIVAFLVAVALGMGCFLVYSYYIGQDFQCVQKPDDFGDYGSAGVAHYPLWVSHFQGEPGLDEFTQVHWIRVWAMVIGFGVFGVLTILRSRFLRFPLHPIGYLLVLSAIYFTWVSPYYKGGSDAPTEASWIWGSVFVAWLVKKLIIKYGGMNTYKRAKPFFVGLVVGALVSIFAWNMVDLGCSIYAKWSEDPGPFMKYFVDKSPYTPKYY